MQSNHHQYWMSKAIEATKNVGADLVSAQRTDIPIGALIVKDNELISTAVNKIEKLKDATAHAEILAIKEASRILGDWRLNSCVLYTTLEPCPMCAGAIINSRISKVIFGAYDLNAGACGSAVNLFSDLGKENGIEVIGGILEVGSSALLKEFFAAKR